MHTINYIDHKLHDAYCYRDFEHDQQSTAVDHSEEISIQRAFSLALPFLSLYTPLSVFIAVPMGAVRVVTSLSATINAAENSPSHLQLSSHVTQTALAIAAFAGSVLKYRIGLLITSGSDIATNLADCVQSLTQRDPEKSFYALGQLCNSILYGSIMLTGSLEITLASYLVQALISAYQSQKEWKEGKQPEAIAKMMMGCIRAYQAHHQYRLIQRRDILLALRHFSAIASRVEEGRNVEHLLDHPLSDIIDRIESEKTVLTNGHGDEYDFGLSQTGVGGAIVKNMNVTFKNKDIDDKRVVELSFRINHVFRDRLRVLLEELQGCSEQDLQDLLKVMGSHASNCSMDLIEANFTKHSLCGSAHCLNLKGLGQIYIGAGIQIDNSSEIPNYPTQYSRVTLHLEEGANLYQLHELLAFLDLQTVLSISMAEDLQRMQIGQLFRTFFPKEATVFERTDAFFELPIDELYQKILSISPEMESIFTEYLPRMELREVMPGQYRYHLSGLSEELTGKGALGLTSALLGAYHEEEVFARVVSILNMGMFSLEQRAANGLQEMGLGGINDLFVGSSDSVFTQMISQNDYDTGKSFENLYYSGKVRFLFSPKLLESGTYQYLYDEFGYRRFDNTESFPYWEDNTYLDRPDILEFIKKTNSSFFAGNEVMIKDRISPEFIKGLIVADEITKNALLEYLKEHGLVHINDIGEETILGKLVDEFIHVGNQIKQEYFV